MDENQYSKLIKVLQSDRGSEYLSKEFDDHLKANGTIRSLMVHDTPEENGVAEQLNCTLLEHTQAMLMTAQLLKTLWSETIHHTVWLKNRTSTCALNSKTPYKVMHQTKLNLTDLLEWGARVFMMKTVTGKLDQKATEACWLGYSGTSKGHHIFGVNMSILINGIKLEYLHRNKLPRIIFVLMCSSDYVTSHVVNEARSSALIDG